MKYLEILPALSKVLNEEYTSKKDFDLLSAGWANIDFNIGNIYVYFDYIYNVFQKDSAIRIWENDKEVDLDVSEKRFFEDAFNFILKQRYFELDDMEAKEADEQYKLEREADEIRNTERHLAIAN